MSFSRLASPAGTEPGAPRSGILAVEGLRVELDSGQAIVEDVGFSLGGGEILGLVGESGSGKTTTSLALLGHARPGARIAAGSVNVAGEEMLGRRADELRLLRGKVVSYVPQDPSSSLNPSLRVGDQVAEMIRNHRPGHDTDAAVCGALARVDLPTDRAFRRRFPHQLSGGQQQRVAIAIALALDPALIVMDEPTTGLDVITQARILDEIERLKTELGLGIVYVSHNLAVVGSIADRIAVMYAGWIVEEGPAAAVLQGPRHPYTRGLLDAVPDHASPRSLRGIPGVAVGIGDRPAGCPFAPRCEFRTERSEREKPTLEPVGAEHLVRCFEWRRVSPVVAAEVPHSEERRTATPILVIDRLSADHATPVGPVRAAEDVSFSLAAGESVALVGESGSGKTTIARCLTGLHPPSGGRILLDGEQLAARAGDRSRGARRRIQIVFQNPYDSLNPRHRVVDAIARPARFLRGLGRGAARTEAYELVERVRLPRRIAERYPRELSGGERQRVALARALAARPDVLVCDEITSALDVSVQAAVVELLGELQAELDLVLLFISHDLGVVTSVCDRILVLKDGLVQEQGAVRTVVDSPTSDYTRALIQAAPRLEAEGRSPA